MSVRIVEQTVRTISTFQVTTTMSPAIVRKSIASALPILVAAIFLWPSTAPVLACMCTGGLGIILLAMASEARNLSSRPPTLRPQLINIWRFTMTSILVIATLASIIAWMIRIRS